MRLSYRACKKGIAKKADNFSVTKKFGVQYLYRLTSYWVMRPFGSTGSSHFRKIMSSSGVNVSDSGAIPPGTKRNSQNKHLSEKC